MTTTVVELEALYGVPVEASIVTAVDRVTPHHQAFIEASPSAVLVTCGPEGIARALIRSDTWSPAEHVPPACLPTPGKILAARSEDRVGSEEYDRAWPERAKQTLW